jgi:hypothetical protein
MAADIPAFDTLQLELQGALAWISLPQKRPPRFNGT